MCFTKTLQSKKPIFTLLGLKFADKICGYVSFLERSMWECVFIWQSARAMKPLGKAGDNSLYTNRPFSSYCSTNLKCYFICQENAIPVCSFFLMWTYFSISKIIVGIWYFSCFVEYLGMLCWELSTTTWYTSKSAA